jgi:hypothetical protein
MDYTTLLAGRQVMGVLCASAGYGKRGDPH